MNDLSAGYRALVEENVKASVRHIAKNPIITNVRTSVVPLGYFIFLLTLSTEICSIEYHWHRRLWSDRPACFHPWLGVRPRNRRYS